MALSFTRNRQPSLKSFLKKDDAKHSPPLSGTTPKAVRESSPPVPNGIPSVWYGPLFLPSAFTLTVYYHTPKYDSIVMYAEITTSTHPHQGKESALA